jgi:DNA helicase IV
VTQTELEAEQRYVDRAYARLEVMLGDARRSAARAAAASESAGPLRDALVNNALARAAHLAIGDEPLIFGRVDLREGRPMYIGRAAVYDEHHEPLVTDWRAPAAEVFYRATPVDPMGVVRRRHLICRGSRVVSIDDELLDEEAADNDGLVLVGEGALLDALGRARTGRMRDIVATIQAEQDAVIRADLEGALVVQGGPGTGKTAVALHRAAYLLYTHRARLERAGVLVVGPNPIFLRYIDQVLPSLGESATLATATELATGARAAVTETGRAARIKGDARMVEVIARGIRNLPRALDEDAVVTYEGKRLTISVAASRRMIALARRRLRGRHNARRRDFVGFVLTYLWHRWRSMQEDWIELVGPDARRHFESSVRAERSFRRAVNDMWPQVGAADFVRGLLRSRETLRAAAQGRLSDDEQDVLLSTPVAMDSDANAALMDEASVKLGPVRRPARPSAPAVDEEEQWSVERMLDDLQETEPVIRLERAAFAERYLEQRRELEQLPVVAPVRERFGYAIIDEAQGLSPMQWRMIARRCPSARMTVLGDLGQAGDIAPASWDEALLHIGAPSVHVAELTINYRTPADIMALAARILELAAPGLQPPRSVRSTGVAPVVESVASDELVGAAARAAREAAEGAPDGKVAVIAADSLVVGVARQLGIDLEHLDAAGLLDAPVTVLATDDARGLEFDAVVVADPQGIADTAAGGLRALYVALTRPTQSLLVIASKLTEPLRSALALTRAG